MSTKVYSLSFRAVFLCAIKVVDKIVVWANRDIAVVTDGASLLTELTVLIGVPDDTSRIK